jgi:hypothetical protein
MVRAEANEQWGSWLERRYAALDASEEFDEPMPV